MSKQSEYTKCYQDKTGRYFIENYLKTFDATCLSYVPFKLFPRQVEFVNKTLDSNNIIAVKPRQSGITTLVAALTTYYIVFCQVKMTILIVSNQLPTSQQLMEKIHEFLNQVPRWMWGDEFYDADPKGAKNLVSIYKKDNTKELELFNGCKIYARSAGKDAARGVSAASIVIFDEAAFIEEGPLVYAQAVATTAAVPNARVFMVSTPHGKDPLYYQTYRQALRNTNNYVAAEFRWYQDPRYNRFMSWNRANPDTKEHEFFREETISTKGDIRYDEEHWAKLIKDGWKPTSPWYENMCKKLNNDSMLIAQELDVSFLGSSDTVIPIEVIEYYKENEIIQITDDWPYHDEFFKDVWIWAPPEKGHHYILGVDPSSGSAEDNTAMEIIDVDALDKNGFPCPTQVAEYYGKINGAEIGELAYQYGTYYNNALIIVEDIGGWGQAALLGLLQNKYPNIYCDDPGIKTPTIEQKYKDYNISTKDKLPGFHMSSVRMRLISNLVDVLKNNGLIIHSDRVTFEMDTWIWVNGRPDHMKGAHDDALMCLAMVMFIYTFSYMRLTLNQSLNRAMINAWTMGSQNVVKDNKFAQNTKNEQVNPQKMFTHSSQQTQKEKVRSYMMLGGFVPRN